jgi:hypothetical protein
MAGYFMVFQCFEYGIENNNQPEYQVYALNKTPINLITEEARMITGLLKSTRRESWSGIKPLVDKTMITCNALRCLITMK